MMVYIKSILVGLGAAILSLVLLVAATMMLISRAAEPAAIDPEVPFTAWDVSFSLVSGTGVGILVVCVIVFALSFRWMMRRAGSRNVAAP